MRSPGNKAIAVAWTSNESANAALTEPWRYQSVETAREKIGLAVFTARFSGIHGVVSMLGGPSSK
jgi:hypothetical protein